MYEAEMHFTLTDADVSPLVAKPHKFAVMALFDVDEDADQDEYGGWLDMSTPRITGYRVKVGDEWFDADETLTALIEAAYVADDGWLMDAAREQSE